MALKLETANTIQLEQEQALHQAAHRSNGDAPALLEQSVPKKEEVLLSHLRLIWARRRFLFRVAFLGLVISAAVAYLIPKRFEATTRLMPPDDASSSAGLGMLAALSGKMDGLSALAGNALGMKTTGALFVGVLRSQTVEDRLVDRFDLKKVYAERLEEDARIHLEEATSISEDRKSGIITITVTDKSPQRAAALAESNVEELDRLVAQLSTSSAHRERVFLEDRLRSVKEDLDDAAKRFGQFASRNAAIDIQAQGKAMLDAAAQLQGQMIAADAQREGLRQIFSDGNIRVRELDARIAELRRQIDKLNGSPSSPLANASIATDAPYPSIRELPLLGVTYADLYRRTKIEEAVYETLTQQFEMAKVQEAKETPSVKVLDPAIVPERKSYPPRLLIMVLGTCLASMCALVWVFGRSQWDAIHSSDPRKAFAREVVAKFRSQNLWTRPNGTERESGMQKIWMRVRGTRVPSGPLS
jgi:uncharacterized protein involved in exopolysaccharide biosynthesis